MNTETRQCECEHVCHFERDKRSPAGNPGHHHRAKFFKERLTTVQHPFGVASVCPDCAKDCCKPTVVALPELDAFFKI